MQHHRAHVLGRRDRAALRQVAVEPGPVRDGRPVAARLVSVTVAMVVLRDLRVGRERGGRSGSDGPTAAGEGVVEPQHDDGPDDRDEQAVEVEARDAGLAELLEQEAADHAEQDIDEHALAGVVDDPARDEAGDQAEDDPGEDDMGGSGSGRASGFRRRGGADGGSVSTRCEAGRLSACAAPPGWLRRSCR